MDYRLCLQGILYVLHQDVAWQLLPLEMGFGSGQTFWRRLNRWRQAGLFGKLHRLLLTGLNVAGELDWSRACVDGCHARAKKGGAATGPSPVDRRKTGSKHHLILTARAPHCTSSRPPRTSTTSLRRVPRSGAGFSADVSNYAEIPSHQLGEPRAAVLRTPDSQVRPRGP
ncbi:transposase [Streptomyces sp. NPDC056121]|uniref:transposase n=1 Tax=Streptomyces sp. NPDC056121 TaxID=3345718 RepID=UPI0035DA104C